MVAYTRDKRKLDDAPIEILHDKEDFEAIISKKKRQEELQCDHGEDYTTNRKGRFLRIIRNVGKENVDPRMLTILNDNIIGPGVIYAYPKDGQVSATLSDRAMKLENLVVSKSDQVWSFEGIAVKFGKGKGLQRCKVGICPFCIKNPTLEREAEIEKIPEKDTEESLIRDRMKLGIRVKDIVYSLEIASE